MIAGVRIAAILAVVFPVVILCGMPEVAPPWVDRELAGVPAMVWLMTAWFAILTGTAWLPFPGDGQQ